MSHVHFREKKIKYIQNNPFAFSDMTDCVHKYTTAVDFEAIRKRNMYLKTAYQQEDYGVE